MKGLIIFLAIIVVIVIYFVTCYNGLIKGKNSVKEAFSTMDVYLKKRWDLIPNLVNTVKGYAKHESEVFTQISEARASAGGQINISDEVLSDPEAFARYQQVQDNLGSSLQRLLVVTENYPELKADQNFLSLQDQLEGTENRITVARQRYNDVARKYNTKVRSFPANIIANMGGFEKKTYFAASAEAQSAPKVEF